MKNRLLAIALAACMLVSLLAAPVFAITFSTAPVAQLEAVSFAENAGSKYLTENTSVTSVKPGETFAVKISIRNTASEELCLAGYKFSLSYDSKAFELYSYSFETEDESGQVGPFARPSQKNGGLSSKWTAVNNTENGAAIFTGTCEDAAARPKIASGGQQTIGYLLLKVSDSAENGSCTVSFTGENYFTHIADGETKDAPVENADFSSKATISITGGKAPTLGSIVVKLGNGTGVYGTASTFQLTALSTKGKDITSLVTFGVKDEKANVVTNKFTIAADGTLSIGTNDAGTYTVHAEPKDNACTATGAAYPTAQFTITPKPITSATVTVTGFGKGLPVAGATATADNMTVARGWYTGEGVPSEANAATGNFAADSPYTLTLQLIPNKNYKLADDLTVTVKGLGADQMIEHASSNPFIVKARTTAKDATKRANGTNLASTGSIHYGDTLSTVQIVAEANKDGYLVVAYIDGKETTIKVPGKFEWVSPTDKVGDACEPGKTNRHKVVFKPDNADLYEGFEAWVGVYVQKKVLDISDLDKTWGNDTLTYTGEPLSIEMNIPNDIAEYVNVAYDNETEGYTNTATDAGDYTAAAVVTPKDANNISLGGATPEEQESRTFTKEWTINKAALTAADKTVEVRYGTASKDLTLADLGLSALANEPGVDISFDVSGKGDVISSAGLTRDTDDKITGISITLSDTKVSDINKTGSVKLTIKSSNYEDKELTITVKIVNKDTKTLTVSGPASFPYGTTADTIKNALTVTGLPDGYDEMKVTYTFSESDISIAAPATDYTVTVGYEDAEFFYTGTHTFEVTARSITDATVTFTDLTYNGSELTTDITVKLGEKTLTKVVDYTVTGDLKGTNAGEYTVTVNGTGNYTGTKEATFTIDKADLSGATITLNSTANMDYDGTPKTTSIAVAFDGNSKMTPTEGVDYTVEFSDNINAGDNAKVTITAKPNGNYTGSKTQTFTINKAKVTVENIAAQDKTYDGTDTATITAELNGVVEKDKANVSLAYPTATFEDANVAHTATGIWAVVTKPVNVTGSFSLTGSAANNYVIDPTPTIPENLAAKIEPKALTLDDAKKTLTVDVRFDDETEKSVSLPVPTGLIQNVGPAVGIVRSQDSSGNYQFDQIETEPHYSSEDGSIKFKLRGGTEKTATAKYVISLNYGDNYTPRFNLALYINISIRSAQSTLTYTGATSVDYDKTLTLSYAGGSGTGNVWYTVEDSMMAEVNGSILTPKAAGNIFITVHKDGDSNYLPATSQKVQVTINKATPATPPEIKVDGGDKKLSDLEAGMRAAMGGIGGTFEWYDSNGNKLESNTKIEANTEYRWKFIPADPNNYNSIEGTTTPYVRDNLSWLPGVLGGGSSFSFHDVTRFDYYYDSVKWAADNGIASGTSRFAFSPDAVCTRAQTVTFLWRAAGSPLPRYRVSPFTDVHSYDYYYEAVLWAVEQGITTGLTATTFGPDETVTRGQVATFLYRAASAAKPNTFNPFTDVKPTAYNYGAILWAYDNRITTGTSTTTFSPDAFCTRAQIVTFLYRYYQGR